jgi:hypothetical protein
MMTNMRFTNTGVCGHNSKVELDGRDISNHVNGLTLTAAVNEPVKVTLDVPVHKVTEYEGDAVVRLSPELEEILLGLGWTPPQQ